MCLFRWAAGYVTLPGDGVLVIKGGDDSNTVTNDWRQDIILF